MIFTELAVAGAYLIELSRLEDERGFYARTWCRDEFEKRGLVSDFAQRNMSFSNQRGTLRGLHWQTDPFAETKLVTCTKGSLYDVMVDMRPESTTYLQWCGVELSAENRNLVYVPKNLAHGFLTLEDNTEILYSSSESYHPECEQGMRYDDPSIGITWPDEICVVSDKDQAWPNIAV